MPGPKRPDEIDDASELDDTARLPTGYRSTDDDVVDDSDSEYLWEEGDPIDRRRDPLRKP